MLKTISIVLPENMIREIDVILVERNYSSRSEFFRVVVRKWLEERGSGSEMSGQEGAEEVGYEFGISSKEIEEIKEKAKFRN